MLGDLYGIAARSPAHTYLKHAEKADKIATAVWGKVVYDELDNEQIIEVDYSTTSARLFRRPRGRLTERVMDIVYRKTCFHTLLFTPYSFQRR